jgi:hypothetical protein
MNFNSSIRCILQKDKITHPLFPKEIKYIYLNNNNLVNSLGEQINISDYIFNDDNYHIYYSEILTKEDEILLVAVFWELFRINSKYIDKYTNLIDKLRIKN